MQHLDEGTIHSWLDGALSADEAARVEAHAKECPQCAAAVAEARGFIAASSRILTALDNAPRGVIPAAAPKKRVDPLVWRVAATVMIVAAGTLVVFRNRGGDERSMSAAVTDSASLTAQRGAVLATAPTTTPTTTEPSTVATDAVSPPRKAAETAGNVGLSKRAAQNPSRPGVSARDNAALPEVASERADRRAAIAGVASAVGVAGAPATAAPMAARPLNRAMMDAATDLQPLKVVGTPRRIGAKVTLYEVAPGDTVTLTESVPLSLQSIVVTGAAQQGAGRAMAPASKTRGVAPAAAPPPPQGEARTSEPGAAAAPTAQVGAVNGFNTIVWSDPATGSTLTLSGQLPEARLREIKIRIERERAAAAAAKKNP